jgi:V8-like Glu-specific endopeptidase
MNTRAVLLAAALTALAMTGCASAGTTPAGHTSAQAQPAASSSASPSASYWTEQRLRAAQAWQAAQPANAPKSAHVALVTVRVGALFVSEPNGDHFCTASVVSSPGRDLLVTAAHCINGGNGGGYRNDIVFIPDYRAGQEPFGVWTPAKLLVAPGWIKSSDPDLDVGFVVLKPNQGRNIEDVLGANTLDFNAGYRNLVRVTGYPRSGDQPVTCTNYTTEQSATQLRFDCDGYTGGTSGSPFVTDFDPKTFTGRIVGVLGGYQQGGDSPNISYSVYLGDAIHQLYEQAISTGS